MKRARNEIAEEIQRLQQKLSEIDEKIATREPELQHLDDERRTQEELRARKVRLTPGADSLDRAVIATIDAARQKALDALLSIL